jgi:flagellar protein FlaG
MSEMGIRLSGNTITPGGTQKMPETMSKGMNKSEGDLVEQVETEKTKDEQTVLKEKERKKYEEMANSLFETLDLGLALKFHEKSGEWYAVIQNKITQEVIKEVPPKYVLELHVKLKEMIGFFLDKKI